MRNSFIRNSFWLSICLSGAIIAGLGAFYLYLSPKLPAVSSLRDIKLQTPLRVLSADGKLIGEFGEKRRYPVSFPDIPEQYIQALLAAEDDKFYSHNGISITGLLRAFSQIASSGQIQSGGSTITMQVARNFFLTRQQTFARKLNEIFLALQIERELSKTEILELYVNVIFLGNRAYGINAAAEIYYGKPLSQLSLAQLAMIAGLPKAPSAFNPIANPDRALIRRNWILKRMLLLDYINQDTYNSSVGEAVTARYHGISLDHNAPYIAEMARQKAVETYGIQAYTDGLIVTTTIDSQLQASAQQAVINGLLKYDARHGYRGAELKWQANFIDPAQTDAQQLSNIDLAPWQAALKNIGSHAGLKPAVVIQVHTKDIKALLSNGEIIDIEWANGISRSRKFRSENARGPRPKKAADVVAVGDVIRVAEKLIPVQVSADDSEDADVSDDTESNTELSNFTAPQVIEPQFISQWHLSQLPLAQAALVSLNPNNGAIQSLIGGFDFNQSHFNRVTQAVRQPGSNFKPFIYTAALENGFSPASIINDAPIVYDDRNLEQVWRPENDGGTFYGPTRLRKALYRSRNLVSIRLLQNTGVRKVISGMDRYGFDKSALPADLSLALGSHAVTPLQIATGYAVFANGGYKISPYVVETINDVNGDHIYQANPATVCHHCQEKSLTDDAVLGDNSQLEQELASELANLELETNPQQSFGLEAGTTSASIETKPEELAIQAEPSNKAERVLDAQVVYLIDSILQDVISKGTGRQARSLNRNDLAGKTGTTNGPRDAWFSGYNQNLVTTTWLGFDQNRLLGRNEYGGSAALPIWIEFMATALKDQPEIPRSQPPGIVTVRIDPNTGERANINTIGAIYESFREANAPEAKLDESSNSSNSSDTNLPEEIF